MPNLIVMKIVIMILFEPMIRKHRVDGLPFRIRHNKKCLYFRPIMSTFPSSRSLPYESKCLIEEIEIK